jgi:hypothetical protein
MTANTTVQIKRDLTAVAEVVSLTFEWAAPWPASPIRGRDA